MKDRLVIDHILFRKLFAETFSGARGEDYRVASSGVRWKCTEEELTTRLHMCSPSDPNLVTGLEIIRDAHLDFPCTPTQVSAWMTVNDTFLYFPDWLREALLQASPVAAKSVLTNAIAALPEDGNDKFVGLPGTDMYFLNIGIEAFQEIERLLPASASKGAKMLPKVAGKLGGETANKGNRAVKAEVIAAYLAGTYASKNAAVAELGEKYHRSPGTVRNYLKGI